MGNRGPERRHSGLGLSHQHSDTALSIIRRQFLFLYVNARPLLDRLDRQCTAISDEMHQIWRSLQCRRVHHRHLSPLLSQCILNRSDRV